MLTLVETITHYLSRIAITVAAALLIYCVAKLWRVSFRAYREVLVMWSIAFGMRWMPKSKSLRIQPYLCWTSDLDSVSVDECFRFHLEAFHLADKTLTKDQVRAGYEKVLLSYSHVLFCREKLDGSLRGLVLMGLEHKKTHTLLKVGLWLMHKHYRGGPWMRLVAGLLILKELILHPCVPVYMIGKASTYKSYISTMVLPDTHPRYDKEAPEEMKRIAEDFVRSINAPMEDYDRDTFVLRRRVGVVNEHEAIISQRDLLNPHIRFFMERNTGWAEGDQLVTLAKMTPWTLMAEFLKVAFRQFSQSPMKSGNVPKGNAAAGNFSRKKASKLRAKLSRGITFQDMEAALHSMRYHTQHMEQNGDQAGTTTSEHYNGRAHVERLYSHSDEEDLNVNL